MTRDADLCLATISMQRALLDSGEMSPVELTEAYLRRIGRLEPRAQSFARVTPDRAIEDARRAETELRGGHSRGWLHGITIGLKDLIDTAGIATTANSRVLAGRVPARDAAVATQLREAGAVLLGKTQLTEFATGKTYRADQVAPQPPNPWAADRFAGGSSSGSAVAVAVGLVGVSVGSDTGGSIRAPASWTGVVGLKPSFGLIATEGVIPLSWSLDHLGPLARCVRDAAMVLEAAAAPADGGSGGDKNYVASADRPITSLRLGVPRALVESVELQPAVRSSFEEALRLYASIGAAVQEVELPPQEQVQAVFLAICGAECVSAHGPWLRAAKELYGRGTWERLMQGLLYTGAEYVDAQRLRTLISRSVATTMRGVDVIALPAMPRTAPTVEEHERSKPLPRAPFLDLANLLGAPAISIPCGFDELGLPIGLHLMGRPFEDARVLQAAAAFERASALPRRVPPLALDEERHVPGT